MRLLVVSATLLLGLVTAGPVLGQDIRDHGVTTRGLVGDGSVRPQAQAAAERAGVRCDVTAARVRSRDADGATHYEVACADAPGYVVSDAPGGPAVNCLAASVRCVLPANLNPRRHYVGMAAEAGLECRVDEGALIGLSTTGAYIYEIGCAGESGAWIEPSPDGGWMVTACLTVRARNGECRFTTREEERATFQAFLADGPLSECLSIDVRAMGTGADGLYYEITCQSGQHVVGRFSSLMRLQEVIACEDAQGVGDGCRPST